MIDQIKAFFDILKDAPDAVGYNINGPISFPLPTDIAEALPDSISNKISELLIMRISVYNYSTKSQRDVRVLYSGDWEFSPKISFSRRDIPVRYTINSEDKEITISELPPNETVAIDLFNPLRSFKIDHVLLGDQQITKGMQSLANARRYPEILRVKLALGLALVSMVAVGSWAGYTIWKTQEETVQHNSKVEKLIKDASLCKFYVVENSEIEKTLDHEFSKSSHLSIEGILMINNATSLEELKQRDSILLCEPL